MISYCRLIRKGKKRGQRETTGRPWTSACVRKKKRTNTLVRRKRESPDDKESQEDTKSLTQLKM